MDYTTQPLAFKVRKALRYVGLYGLRRTRVKIESHRHMNKRYSVLPPTSGRPADGRSVAIIGCGKFAFAQIAYYLRKNFGNVIYGAMDIDIDRAASLFETYGLVTYSDDAESLIADPAVDTVFIASNHATHAEYAIAALEHGKTTHIEKPHVCVFGSQNWLQQSESKLQKEPSGKHWLPPQKPNWQSLCADCFRAVLNVEPSTDQTMTPINHARRARKKWH